MSSTEILFYIIKKPNYLSKGTFMASTTHGKTRFYFPPYLIKASSLYI